MNEGERVKSGALKFYVTAGAVLVLDQLTKLIARAALEPGQTRNVIPGFFDIKLSYNTGAAFGVLPDWAPLFIVVALVTIFAVVKLGRTGHGSRVFGTGLGLLLGGAIGNLIDRLTHPSSGVTDFLSVHVSLGGAAHAWPTFNIADIGIVVGAVLVVFNVYVLDRHQVPPTGN